MKIGLVKFLNCFPLKLALQNKHEVIEGTPAQINALYKQGKLDAGMVSSVEYLKHRDTYILGGGCIASKFDGVGSVLLFSKVPIENIKTLALPKDSATSNALVQLLVAADRIDYHSYEKSIDDFLQTYDGVLFIGDNALFAKTLSGHRKYDLAQLWTSKTGLPMVFAVMVGAKVDMDLHYDIDKVVELASKSGDEKDVLDDYFRNKLQFELGDDEKKSLELLAKFM